MTFDPPVLGSIALAAEAVALRPFRIRIAYTETVKGARRSFVREWLVVANDPEDAVRRATRYISHLACESDVPWHLAIDRIEITATSVPTQGAPTLRAVLASGDPGTDGLLEDYICDVVGQSGAVQFVRTRSNDLLRKICKEEDIHLVVIVLNNIVLSEAPADFGSLSDVMDLLRFIRTTADCPIIALWGRDYERSVHASSLAAGANFFFEFPCDPDALLSALDVCALGWPRARAGCSSTA